MVSPVYPKLPAGFSVPRLRRAMDTARRALQSYRQERLDAVKQYVGKHWGAGGTRLDVPVNMIGLYVSIMSRALVSKHPKGMFSTFDKAVKPAVTACERWANREAEKTGLKDTGQRAVLDALFSMGVVKVGVASPADAAVKSWNLSAGTPFADVIDLDDWVFDVNCRNMSEAEFMGHRYWCPLDVANALYVKGKKEKIAAGNVTDYNPEGDEKIGFMGRGQVTTETLEDGCYLWEIYVARHRLVLTLRDDDDAAEPLRVQRWVGPAEGPYCLLNYGVVPGNPMGKAPVMDLVDLHNAVNRCYRKLIRQVDRQKSILPLAGAATEEGSRVKQANDGDIIQADNAVTAKEVSYGGPSQGVFEMAQHLKDLFSFMGGGLEMIGGLAPQSRTAAQDKMLNENSSRTVQDMQETTVTFMADVFRRLAWFWWHHPQKVMDSHYEVPGVPQIQVPTPVTPGKRGLADWDAIDVKIDPYSLVHTTPQSRLAYIDAVITQLTPIMPLLQQQGIMFDVNKLLDIKARYGDEPELTEIFTVQAPPQIDAEGPGGAEKPGMPPNTTREYVRRSVGGDSPQAKGQALQARLRTAGGAGLNRPMGGGA